MAQTSSTPIPIRFKPNLAQYLHDNLTHRYDLYVRNGMKTLRDQSFRPKPAEPVAIREAITRFGLENQTVVVEVRVYENDLAERVKAAFPGAMVSLKPDGQIHALWILYV